MSTHDSAEWSRARLARDQLEKQLINNPDVRVIDITSEPSQDNREAGQRLIVRVQVTRVGQREPHPIPSEIDGIPVRVVVAPDYRLE